MSCSDLRVLRLLHDTLVLLPLELAPELGFFAPLPTGLRRPALVFDTSLLCRRGPGARVPNIIVPALVKHLALLFALGRRAVDGCCVRVRGNTQCAENGCQMLGCRFKRKQKKKSVS